MVYPLASDGVPGKLTSEQTQKLKKMWKELFELVDNAPEEGSGGGKVDDDVTDEKAAQKNIPKDDNAKEALRQQKEKEAAEKCLKEYGRKAFMACMWRAVALDDPDMLVLRFLRARKWSTSAGTAMMASCIRWRLSSGVEQIVEKGEEGMKDAEGELYLEMSARWTWQSLEARRVAERHRRTTAPFPPRLICYTNCTATRTGLTLVCQAF